MTTRGRPKKEGTKRGQYRLRMSEEEEKMLDYICEARGQSKAEVIREALRVQYNLEKTRSYWDIQ